MRLEDFAAAVHKTVLRFGMDLARPLAMVSGGPDSVAMLRVLMELGASPVVLHVDHGLRGEESRDDAEFVRVLCENLGVPYEARRIELSGTNLQEGAREERYRLAEEVAEGRGLSAVATGHIADDVAETVLLNLARGAGLRGLSGIPPVRGLFAAPDRTPQGRSPRVPRRPRTTVPCRPDEPYAKVRPQPGAPGGLAGA